MTSQPATPALERVENGVPARLCLVGQPRETLPPRRVSAGETLEGVQLCPPGDWTASGKLHHCTEEALQGLCNRWQESGGITGNCNAETPEAFRPGRTRCAVLGSTGRRNARRSSG
ncbi:MAG: hypothetical protein IJS32_04250 [Kiritimatiellae bacterium]|nr:hypothetical protein [Kiritimatiellia bacterium]